jgi:transcription antitermination factor NusG
MNSLIPNLAPPIPAEVAAQVSTPLLAAHWYAAYTLPRHEKIISEQLAQKSVECYLPLYEKLNRWADRTARVQLPLFPGYVFVRISLNERVRVLELPSILRIVGFNGRPAALPDGEIEALQRALATRKAEPVPYLAVGKRVHIHAGVLEGLEGIIVRRKGNLRIVVSVDSIMRSIAVELEAADVRVVP